MPIDFEKVLDKDQYKAVTHKDGTVLILAGAGSGKTRTLTHRVAWLVEQGVSPSEILLLTFTNKAADEMRDRAAGLLDDRCKDVTACTYHSFCVRMLRRYGDRIGIGHDFGILGSPDVESVLAVVRSNDQATYRMRGFPPNKVVASMISMTTNTGRDLRDVIEEWANHRYGRYVDQVEELAKGYVAYKRRQSLLDYDDLLTQFIRLIETHEDVRRRISDTYRYIMVDEYQDTNRLQERMLFDLRRDCDNLMVVGDDYQSIYAFRGADINNILKFPKRVRKCDDIVHIGTNYRSGIEICDLANAVMRQHARFGYPKSMRAKRWSDRQPMVVRPVDEEAEAEWVVDEMRRLHDEEGLRWQDMAVLSRAGRDTFRIENLLNAAGVAYEKYGGLKFLEYRCVLDVIAFLRVLARPDDELSWFRILVLYPGIGERYARLITEKMDRDSGGDPNAFLLDRAWARRKFGRELEMLHNSLESFAEMEFDELPRRIVRYYLDLRKRVIQSGTYDDEANRSEDMERLDEDAVALDALVAMTGAYKSIEEFLDAIILDALPRTPTQAKALANATEKDEPQDMVVLSTIHSIKGLEFPAVFVLDCVDGKFPRSRGNGEAEDEEMEDLRCFYVAITRAKDWLYICAPQLTRRYDGMNERSALTHFLDGVDDDLYVIEPSGDDDSDSGTSGDWNDWDGFGLPF